MQCTKGSWLSCLCVACMYLNDWLAECLPLHGVTKGFIHGSTGQSNGTNCNLGGVGWGWAWGWGWENNVKTLMLSTIGALLLTRGLVPSKAPMAILKPSPGLPSMF